MTKKCLTFFEYMVIINVEKLEVTYADKLLYLTVKIKNSRFLSHVKTIIS